jgi:hypothetical protein
VPTGLLSSTYKPVTGSAATVFNELRRCFNCNFPINGAPRDYPKEGQLVPLRACFGLCRNAPVSFHSDEKSYIRFTAQPGHFDGAGSTAEFSFLTGPNNQLHLRVSGYVTNPDIPDTANKIGAYTAWSQFAQKLGSNIWKYQCNDRCV